MNDVPVLVAFGAGLLSFLSPCCLPVIPVYLISIAGVSLTSSSTEGRRFAIFAHSVSFVLGFTLIFTLMGAGAGLLGLAISDHIDIIRQVSGVLMIAMGLFLLLALKVPWLNFEKRLAMGDTGKTSYLRSFLTGGIFSLGWTPCVGPILGGILSLAMTTGTALKGGYLLIIYSLGMGLPFILLGAAFDGLRPVLRKIQRYSVYIYVVSSVLLIGIGVLVIMDKLAVLSV